MMMNNAGPAVRTEPGLLQRDIFNCVQYPLPSPWHFDGVVHPPTMVWPEMRAAKPTTFMVAELIKVVCNGRTSCFWNVVKPHYAANPFVCVGEMIASLRTSRSFADRLSFTRFGVGC